MQEAGAEGAADEGLTFDDTTEFVRTITYDPSARQQQQQPQQPIAITIKTRRSPSHEELGPEMDVDVKREEGEASESEDDEAVLNLIEQAISGATAAGANEVKKEAEREDDGVCTWFLTSPVYPC